MQQSATNSPGYAHKLIPTILILAMAGIGLAVFFTPADDSPAWSIARFLAFAGPTTLAAVALRRLGQVHEDHERSRGVLSARKQTVDRLLPSRLSPMDKTCLVGAAVLSP